MQERGVTIFCIHKMDPLLKIRLHEISNYSEKNFKHRLWTGMIHYVIGLGGYGLPWWLSGKETACSAGDVDLVPGFGRSPAVGHGNPLHYSCLENPLDRGAWWAMVRGVTKSQTWLKWLRTFEHWGWGDMLVAGIRLPVRENLYWDTTSMKAAWGNENKWRHQRWLPAWEQRRCRWIFHLREENMMTSHQKKGSR